MTALLFEFEPGPPRGQLGNGVDASMAIVLFAAPSMDNRHRLERAVEAPFTDNNGEETQLRGPRPGSLPKPHKQRAPRAPRHSLSARALTSAPHTGRRRCSPCFSLCGDPLGITLQYSGYTLTDE